jgi:hypothetical protein
VPQPATRLSRLLLHRWLGLICLVAVCLPAILWRASLESSLWIDETYSVMLTTHSTDRLVRITSADLHPPGYYLALKAWLHLARRFGHEPGVLWARCLNVFAWMGMVSGSWVMGRRLLGARGGSLLTWLVGGGAYAALWAREIRGYGVASTCLVLAFLVLLALAPGEDHRDRRPAAVVGLWAVYAVLTLAALWCHLLSALAFGVLTSLWAVLFLRRWHLAPTFVVSGLGALVVVTLGFSPWLARLGEQLAVLEANRPDWMTPATWPNLGWVFGFWYPFGRIGAPTSSENRLLFLLGFAGLAVPAAAALSAALRGRTTGRDIVGRAAVLALGAAVGFTALIWALARSQLVFAFHGPRYPGIAAPLFAAGLALAARWSADRLGWRPGAALAVVAIFLLCSAIGQNLAGLRESRWGLADPAAAMADVGPAPGEALYAMPSQLLPFYRRTLAGFRVVRGEDLPCAAPAVATVLNLNFWPELDHTRDRILLRWIQGPLAEGVDTRRYPARQGDYTIYRLHRTRRGEMARLCAAALRSEQDRRLAHAAARGLPGEQAGPGWSFLEVGDDLSTRRWATSADTRVVFDRRVEAGHYDLHVAGYRAPYPREEVEMRFELEGADGPSDETVGVASGEFHVRFPVRFAGFGRPLLVVEHPTWSPAAVGLPETRPSLAWVLRAAWLTDRK